MGAVAISKSIERDKTGEIVDGHILTEDQFNQIKKYISLLAGDVERNGISFLFIAECLGIDSKKLHDIYLLVEAVRGLPESPPGYEWKLVKKKEA